MRNIDQILYEYYCQKLQEQTGEDPRKNQKVKVKLLLAIEKQRKNLSADDQTNIDIDYLFCDEDFIYNMKR